MWDLPRAGIEPVSPALAGGFLTTAPPGKSHRYFLCSSFFIFQIFHSEFVMIIRNIVICIFKKETHITILSSTTLAACGMEFHLFIRFIFQTRSYALLCLLPSHFPCLKSFCFCWEQLPSHSSPLHQGKIRLLGFRDGEFSGAQGESHWQRPWIGGGRDYLVQN